MACWKYRMRKLAKNSPSTHHCTTLSGYIFAVKACIDGWKKLVKQQYLLCMTSQYGELRPTSGWDRLASLGTPANFNGFRILASLLHQRRSVEVNQTLHDVWAGTLYMHFRRHLPPNGILRGTKFTLHPSLAFSYIGSIAVSHSSSEHQPNFAAFSRGRHLYLALWPSRWASTHILVMFIFCPSFYAFLLLPMVSAFWQWEENDIVCLLHLLVSIIIVVIIMVA